MGEKRCVGGLLFFRCESWTPLSPDKFPHTSPHRSFMSVDRAIVLLPGHGIDDLPGQLTGDSAAQFLACWTAAWHPALMLEAGIPQWFAADQQDFERAGSLLLLCEAAKSWLSPDFAHDASANGATIVEADLDRTIVVKRALEAIGRAPAIADDLVADFYAFGYWFLQTELLSYQLRYTSGLDPSSISEHVLTAARAAAASDRSTAKSALSAAFGVLTDQRSHYYPVDSFVLDVTLVAKFNCGEPLRAELQAGYQRNIWLTGETVEAMAEQEPQSIVALREALVAGRAEILGGEFNEPPTSLLARREVVGNLRAGHAAFRRHLDCVPQVFARRRFGLGPVWPQVWQQANYDGALHSTFDSGRFPANLQARSQWRGLGDSRVNICGQVTRDASLPETALGLGATMGESMENDFVATVVLVRWAGQRTVWLDDFEAGQRFF